MSDLLENKPESILPQEQIAQPTLAQTAPQAAEAPKEETQEDPNWRAFREARKQDRLQREAAEKLAAQKAEEAAALKAAMDALLNKPQNQPQYQQQPGYGYQDEETEEQRIERKVLETIEKREAIYEQQRREREHQEYPQRLQRDFSDFNNIVSSDNLDYLEYHYPEIAGPLKRAQDGYDKWSDIYKAVKRFVPNTNHKKEASRAEANFNKPKSMSTTQLTERGDNINPVRIDEAKKQANWERMQRIMNKLS
jgi:hypothetical protein